MRRQDKIITRGGTKYYCSIYFMENTQRGGLYNMTIYSNGNVNEYHVNAKIGGLSDCKTSSLYLFGETAFHIVTNVIEETNEDTLTNEAVIDLFDEVITE